MGIKVAKCRYGFFYIYFLRIKWRSKIKSLGVNTQTLEQLRKIFEENIQQGSSGILFSKSQKPEAEERIDTCIMELRILASTCNFRDIKDLLIRDRVICGTCDSSLWKELQRKRHPTLEEWIKKQEQLNCPGKGIKQWQLLLQCATYTQSETRRHDRDRHVEDATVVVHRYCLLNRYWKECGNHPYSGLSAACSLFCEKVAAHAVMERLPRYGRISKARRK